MRRAGALWPGLCSLPALHRAALAARRRKRYAAGSLDFFFRLEHELAALYRELSDGGYCPGPYSTFWIEDPKRRLISAAPFRDRVVHHALMAVLGPVLEARLPGSSFANRIGRGTHRALRLARHHLDHSQCVLVLDVWRFFPSIDHSLLLAQVERAVKCQKTLALLRQVVAASPPQEDPGRPYFPDDDLFAPALRRRGLPIGNLTSQHLANFYLAGVDRLVLERLRLPRHVRFMDDLLVFGDDRARLIEARAAIDAELLRLRLRPHPLKTRVQPTRAGFSFLGFDLRPGRARLPRPALGRARRHLLGLAGRVRRGERPPGDLLASLRAWRNHAAQAEAPAVVEAVCEEVLQRFRPAHQGEPARRSPAASPSR